MAPITTDARKISYHFAAGILKRASPDKKCDGDNDPKGCPVSPFYKTTLPIILGVGIPVLIALITFLLLHRRHVRKLRNEDAEGKDQSLDYGMGDFVPAGKNKSHQKLEEKDVPHMSRTETEKSLRPSRGMSLDLDINHPYALPPQVHDSKDTLLSMPHSTLAENDKYRMATSFVPSTTAPTPRSNRTPGADDASLATDISSAAFSKKETESSRSLFRDGQNACRSDPSTRPTSVNSVGDIAGCEAGDRSGQSSKQINLAPTLTPGSHREAVPEAPTQMATNPAADSADTTSSHGIPRNSDHYLGALIQRSDVNIPTSPTTFPSGPQSELFLPEPKKEPINRQQSPLSIPESTPLKFDFANFDAPHESPTSAVEDLPSVNCDNAHITVTSPAGELHSDKNQQMAPTFGQGIQRLSMGFRPLPPDDPSDDPEQRANRIRSFYKEYFDETKIRPFPGQSHDNAARSGQTYSNPYYDEIYGQQSHANGAAATRRAMTPPPRAARGKPSPNSLTSSRSGGYGAHYGPRSYSAASGQGRHGGPKKSAPPPLPLQLLPTPHLLSNDDGLAIDFAPPTALREQRAGTPDTLRGGTRPYSPTVPAHLPLASSFDDLTAMPSP